MQRFVTTATLFAAVLLAGTVCFAQDAKPEMWDAYKKVREGKWETTLTTAEGVVVTATLNVEVIFDGKAVLESATWTSGGGTLNLKGIGNWCPKQKSIVTRTVDSWGGHSEAVITLADGEERGSTTLIDADGTEDSTKSVTTVIDNDTLKVAFVEGRWAGGGFTWKRKRD